MEAILLSCQRGKFQLPDFIIQFLNGNGDHTITTGSTNIQTKSGGPAHCPIINVPFAARANPNAVIPALQAALQGATAYTRIYLRGHGNWSIATLGGWTALSVAILLNANGLAQACVISITGCNAARAPSAGEQQSTTNMNHQQLQQTTGAVFAVARQSFAGIFHAALCSPAIGTQNIPVTGRIYSVDVDQDGHKKVRVGPGRLLKPGVGDARRSKIIFQWNGGQTKAWIMPGHAFY